MRRHHAGPRDSSRFKYLDRFLYLLLFLGTGLAARGQELWVSHESGKWSERFNWLDGTPPPNGGGDDLTLRFSGSSDDTIIAVNDLGTPFLLNRLILESNSSNPFTIQGPASVLQFCGSDPGIKQVGDGTVILDHAVTLASASGVTLIEGQGDGTVVLNGRIDESSRQALHVHMAPSSNVLDQVVLAGNNGFTGGVILEAGNLALQSSTGLGTGTLEVHGGTLQISSPLTIGNNIELHADLVITRTGTATLAGVISSAGNYGVIVQGAGGIPGPLRFTEAATYTGATIITEKTLTKGSLQLAGNGSLLHTSEI
ncbi:MAG TPA: hypothetical protein VFV83_05870, partial [Chthoniobacteraceae bacterium]|nr:hypothetical protein [Chthoniobacteraceae bacterium]